MIIYKDIISGCNPLMTGCTLCGHHGLHCILPKGDELTSDTYKITPLEGQPLLWKVVGRSMTKSGDKIDDSLFGGNASAEAPAEDTTDDGGSTQVIDIIDGPRLASVPAFAKTSFKDFRGQMKPFVKGVVDRLEDPAALAEFKAGAAAALKFIYSNLADYEFYVGESMNPDGATGYLNYEEDGVTPYLLFFKHALVEEKC